jgi:hypothetical protein
MMGEGSKTSDIVGSRNDVSFEGYQAKGDEKRQGEGGGVIKSGKFS